MSIPDEKLSKFLNVVYNVWFNKWKRKIKNMTDEDWKNCMLECLEIEKQGKGSDLVRSVCKAFWYELEERAKEK